MNLFLYFAGEWYKRQIAPEKEQRVILEGFDYRPSPKKPYLHGSVYGSIRVSRNTHLVINCHRHTWVDRVLVQY